MRHYNDAMAWTARQEAAGQILAAAAVRRAEDGRLACTCAHPPSEHGDDGCLYGWGEPPASGCMCMAPGTADR